MKYVFRFAVGFIHATMLLLFSGLFLKSTKDHTSIRKTAMWLVGMDRMY